MLHLFTSHGRIMPRLAELLDDNWDHFPYFSIKNIHCGYLSEVPLLGTSNKYPQHVFMEK